THQGAMADSRVTSVMASPRPNLSSGVRAVLFDVDGTLYHQWPVRFLMSIELAALLMTSRSWGATSRTWRTVMAFRAVQETQRAAKTVAVSAMERQFIETARCLGLPREDVEQTIAEWM